MLGEAGFDEFIDGVKDGSRVQEADFGFGRVNVHVKKFGRDFQEKSNGRKLSRQERLSERRHDGLLKKFVANTSSIDDLQKFFGRGDAEPLKPVHADFKFDMIARS